jgi:uncharacterized protein
MHVAELWRYPVKSMSGEPLREASVGPLGLHGDRLVHVRDAAGRLATARSRPALLRHRAVLGPGDAPLVDGRPWDSPEVARDVEAAAGPGARLMASEGPERFDILPLLIATDGALAAFGRDPRRLRPNIVLGGVEGLAERGWEGRTLRIGDVTIALADLRERCVMTTFDPDTAAQDVEVLRAIRRDFGGRLCLNAAVERGGRIRVGDAVSLAPSSGA